MQNVITNKINCTFKKGFEDTCTITASNIFFLGPNVAKDVVYTCYCRQRNVSLDSFFAFILLIKRTYVVAWTICSIHVCMSQPCMSETHRSLVYSIPSIYVFFLTLSPVRSFNCTVLTNTPQSLLLFFISLSLSDSDDCTKH